MLPGVCSADTDGARVYISELPDGGGDSTTPIRQHCLCHQVDANYDSPISFVSNTSAILLEFVVRNMRPDQDFDDLGLSGSFSFVHEPTCQLRKVATGAGGEILLRRHEPPNSCTDQPWVIRSSRPGKFIYVKAPGGVLYTGSYGSMGNVTVTSKENDAWCETRDRVYIYTGGGNVTVVCPTLGANLRSVDLFSEGWAEARVPFKRNVESKKSQVSSVVVKYVARTEGAGRAGPYLLQWLELSPTPDKVRNRNVWLHLCFLESKRWKQKFKSYSQDLQK